MQKDAKGLILFFLFLVFKCFLSASEYYENKIKDILKNVFGIERCIVNVRFLPKESRVEEKTTLPGVPEIGKDLKDVSFRIDINIILPEDVKVLKQEVINFLKENLSLMPDDIVNVKYIQFKKEEERRQYLKNLSIRDIVIYLFIFIVLIFLFGPVRVFIKNFNRAIKKSYVNYSEEDVKFTETKPPALPYTKEESTPFSFINEDNIKDVSFVLRKESPEKISCVAGFLREGLFKRFLEFFPPEVQEEIILNLSRENELPYKEVKRMEEEIKNKIKLVVGGKEKIIKILEELTPERREKFIDFLSVETPELSTELKNMIFSFDDIEKFSYKELKFILKYLKTPLLLKALKFAGENVKDKIFTLLSPKTVRYIKEEIKDDSISEDVSIKAQKEILRIIRELMDKGLI